MGTAVTQISMPKKPPSRPGAFLFVHLLAGGILAAGDAGSGRAPPFDGAPTPRPPLGGVGVPLIVPPNPFARPFRGDADWAEEARAPHAAPFPVQAGTPGGGKGGGGLGGASFGGGAAVGEQGEEGEEGEMVFNPGGLPRAEDDHLYPPSAADLAREAGIL